MEGLGNLVEGVLGSLEDLKIGGLGGLKMVEDEGIYRKDFDV